MNRFSLTTILFLFARLSFGQAPPLPPKPPTQERAKSKEDSNTQQMYGEPEKVALPKFNIPLSASSNLQSIYYFKTVEDKLARLDTTITAEQIISLTKFNISRNQTDPKLLDSLANRAYKQNGEKNYAEAVKTAKSILAQSPTNITAHKEIALAYKGVGEGNLSNRHFAMMIKIIMSVFKYGDGTYDYPFLVNNFFEGFSVYEAAFRCKPNKVTLMLDKKGRLLGAYNGYSSAMDEILIRYSELSHWKPKLKRDQYIVEE